MSKKLYVIKNIKTKKYFSGQSAFDGPCTSRNLENAEIFDDFWVKNCNSRPDENNLKRNEKFVEIEIREK